MSESKLLVTGASGQLGRLVVRELLSSGLAPQRLVVTTRKPESLAELAAQGVDVRAADFDDADSLARAFAGVDRLLLVSTDAIDRPGHRLQQHRRAVAAARSAGVKHVVYTSMPNPEPGSPVTFAGDHYGTEQALAASGIGHTVLRNYWYMDNLLQSLPSVLAGGKWFTAAGDGRVAYVTRADCARAAAAALASDETRSATHDITGPDSLSTADIAQRASAVTGKPIEIVPATPEQLAAGMTAHGLPAFLVPVLVSFDVNTAQGRVAQVSASVRQLTGRAPQSLADFLAEHKAALAG